MNSNKKKSLLLKDFSIFKRVFFTLFILFLIRIITALPLPWIDIGYMRHVFRGNPGFDFYNLITGGGLESFSIFSLSVSPYITASMIVQLLTFIFPSIEEIQRSGERGKRLISKWTQRLSLLLCILQSWIVAYSFSRVGMVIGGSFPIFTIMLCLVAGTSILMWLANKITENGVGNGVSLILLLNVLSRIPREFIGLYEQFVKGESWLGLGALILIVIAISIIVLLTIFISEAIRKIPVKQAGVYKKLNEKGEFIPLKVNTGNVTPVIFASSIMTIPTFLGSILGEPSKGILKSLYHATNQENWFVPETWKLSLGYFIYAFLIFYFSYFHTEIILNSAEISDSLKRSSATIPNVAIGEETEDYLNKIIKPLTFLGALLLTLVVTLPFILSGLFNITISFAGTSLIIVSSIMIETIDQFKLLRGGY